MLKAPYMNFPFPFYRNYYRIQPNFQGFSRPNINDSNSNYSGWKSNVTNSNNKIENRGDCEAKNKSNKNTDNFLFDLFGLKIYYDDVLLVSLIYFLYSEGVKDDGLFIVLILLLLS